MQKYTFTTKLSKAGDLTFDYPRIYPLGSLTSGDVINLKIGAHDGSTVDASLLNTVTFALISANLEGTTTAFTAISCGAA